MKFYSITTYANNRRVDKLFLLCVCGQVRLSRVIWLYVVYACYDNTSG